MLDKKPTILWLYFDVKRTLIPRIRDKIIIAKGLACIIKLKKLLKSMDKIERDDPIST